jgi:MFS family permease
VFLGHYQAGTSGAVDEGWTECSNGVLTNYTAWWQQGDKKYNSQPASEDDRFEEDCVVFSVEKDYAGWWDSQCLRPYTCLCEKGTESTAAYQSWCEDRQSVWLKPYRFRAASTFVGGLAVGLLPVAYHAFLFFSGKIPGDWSVRVQARVSAVMLCVGWLLACLGFAPSLAFLLGLHAMPVLGYPTTFMSIVSIGIVSSVLATPPESPRLRSLCVVLLYFLMIAVLGVLLALMYIKSWLAGFSLGCVLVFLGLSETVLLLRTFKIIDVRERLEQVWKLLRFSFAVLAALAVLMIAEAYVEGYQGWSLRYEDMVYGWSAIAFMNVCCAILTTGTLRNRFCVWLAALGRSTQDKLAAEEAARLIWVDFDEIGAKPVTVGKPLDAES